MLTVYFACAKILNGIERSIHEKYPWYLDEMRGMADGAKVPLEHVRRPSVGVVANIVINRYTVKAHLSLPFELERDLIVTL